MSNHSGQIYSTIKNAERYIVLNSQNVEISGGLNVNNNLLINGHIDFEQTDSQVVASDPSGIVNLVNNLLTSNHDASFNNVDVSGNLSVNGGLDISGHIIITVDDVNSQNTTLLELKTNSNTPRIKHDFWQNSSGYADYQIYPTSASTTDFKIGGYDATFQTIRLNALNGIEVYSNQSTNSYGNIKCNDASFNNVDISGDLNASRIESGLPNNFIDLGLFRNNAMGNTNSAILLSASHTNETHVEIYDDKINMRRVVNGINGPNDMHLNHDGGNVTVQNNISAATATITGNMASATASTTGSITVGNTLLTPSIRLNSSGTRDALYKYINANHSPHMYVGDVEPNSRWGFDFKFNWGAQNATNTLFRAYLGGNSTNRSDGWFQVFCNAYNAKGQWHSSDDRYKHGEINIENGLETIRQLVPKTYKKTENNLGADNDGTNIGIEDKDWWYESGLIAQEIEKIPTLTEYVVDVDGYKCVKYNDIHCHTIAGLKELDAIVTAQAELITKLENRITILENS